MWFTIRTPLLMDGPFQELDTSFLNTLFTVPVTIKRVFCNKGVNFIFVLSENDEMFCIRHDIYAKDYRLLDIPIPTKNILSCNISNN